MSERTTIQPDVAFIRAVHRSGGDSLKKCYQCATCSVVCELSPEEKPFPRKEMLWAQWGQTDKLISDPDVWLCHQCNDCSERCPRGAKPGDVLAAVRAYVYQKFAFPGFMGKAMATPSALPLLFLLPVMIIFGLMWMTTNGDMSFFTDPHIEYGKMLAHGYLEMFFIAGNLLIFGIAAVGLYRFWSQLQHSAGKDTGKGFIAALISVVIAILTHRHFESCKVNRPRKYAHLLVMYGFAGAALTAGLAVVYTVILHNPGPLSLENPIKILGAVSGTMIFVGSTWLLFRRNNSEADVGADGYPDQLFLWMIFMVGVTGMLSWLLRLAGNPAIAYSTYFVHMVCVYFLLWYMPYGKFAHMLYRGLALVWAEQHGRILGSKLNADVSNINESDEGEQVSVSAA
ncbi:quinone-interacting membrane-bound oxidoreductase complex subunit QmoC [bacterium]|nr:quinone-interacting membrane-bound oxidoreductase complex subunit QmoC [bacterium]